MDLYSSLDVHVTGQGNQMYTILVGFDELCIMLVTTAPILGKHLSKMLGCRYRKNSQGEHVLNGAFQKEILIECLQQYN